MPLVLVVDDNPLELAHARALLEKAGAGEWEVAAAADGAAALRSLEDRPADLMLTDLKMPGMTGLELIEAVRDRWAGLPTVLMTAEGSEEIACEALRLGASNYVAKRRLADELPGVCRSLLEAAARVRQEDELLGWVSAQRVEYSIPSDRKVAARLAHRLQDHAAQIARLDDSARTRLGVALEEALLNAVIHGNLEVSSELRERGDSSFDDLVKRRTTEEPYAGRRVAVSLEYAPSHLTVAICDEGPGFDVAALPDPTDPENLLKASGRGVMLMRAFMDDVQYNDRGNEVTLTKRLTHADPAPPAGRPHAPATPAAAPLSA